MKKNQQDNNLEELFNYRDLIKFQRDLILKFCESKDPSFNKFFKAIQGTDHEMKIVIFLVPLITDPETQKKRKWGFFIRQLLEEYQERIEARINQNNFDLKGALTIYRKEDVEVINILAAIIQRKKLLRWSKNTRATDGLSHLLGSGFNKKKFLDSLYRMEECDVFYIWMEIKKLIFNYIQQIKQKDKFA